MYAEADIRCVKRALQRVAAYLYNTPGDKDRLDCFDGVPVNTHYSDDNLAVTGDTPDAQAEQHITDIVCGRVLELLEDLAQFVDRGKSWGLHQREGAPQQHEYRDAAGREVADASIEAAFKLLGYFFPTDARNDATVAAAIETTVAPRFAAFAAADVTPAVRVAALRDAGLASLRHHARGTWSPDIVTARRWQDELLTTIVRKVIEVPLVTPTELPSTAHVPVIAEHLALPINQGGVGLTLMVVRDHATGKDRLGPLFAIPALESLLTAATSDRPSVVEATRQLLMLANWKPKVWDKTGLPPRWKKIPSHLPERTETDKYGAIRAVAAAARELAAQKLMLVFHTDRSPSTIMSQTDANVSPAAVIGTAKAAAHQANVAFLRVHYKYLARFSRIPTALPDATHWWLQPNGAALLDDAEYRLFFRARYGLLPLNAHRSSPKQWAKYRESPAKYREFPGNSRCFKSTGNSKN